MQFHQPIHTSDLEYELMGIDGVRAVNFVKLAQGNGEGDFMDLFSAPLWDYDKTTCPGGVESACTPQNVNNNADYGWKYDFIQFYGDEALATDGVILPSQTPSVFELKNPRDNVKGIVR